MGRVDRLEVRQALPGSGGLESESDSTEGVALEGELGVQELLLDGEISDNGVHIAISGEIGDQAPVVELAGLVHDELVVGGVPLEDAGKPAGKGFRDGFCWVEEWDGLNGMGEHGILGVSGRPGRCWWVGLKEAYVRGDHVVDSIAARDSGGDGEGGEPSVVGDVARGAGW